MENIFINATTEQEKYNVPHHCWKQEKNNFHWMKRLQLFHFVYCKWLVCLFDVYFVLLESVSCYIAQADPETQNPLHLASETHRFQVYATMSSFANISYTKR